MKSRWVEKQIGDIANISYGYTAKAKQEEIGPRFLRITDIKNHGVRWDAVPYCKRVNQNFSNILVSLNRNL